jgi:DNA-directed RNA polymerase subunit E'/Rpb7
MTSRDWERRIEKLIAEVTAAVPARIVSEDKAQRNKASSLIVLSMRLQEANDVLWAMHEVEGAVNL